MSPAVAGTNSWIWQHPVYHAFSGQDAGILWIRGKPGSGKSVLAKSIQRKLLAQSVVHQGEGSTTLVGDWFYHRRRAGRYIQHESFLRSILYHFLQQCTQLFHDFFVKAYRAMDPQSVSEVLRNVCQGSRPVICIIDAVDEAKSVDIICRPYNLFESEIYCVESTLLSRLNDKSLVYQASLLKTKINTTSRRSLTLA